ncbi:MAG: hypothetical protein ACI4I6_10710 [Hominimerdicola sp.]
MKECLKCKQLIPIDCEECKYCGQIQPTYKNDEDNMYNEENAKKENSNKQWWIASIIITVGVIVCIGIIPMIIMHMMDARVNEYDKIENAYQVYTQSTTEQTMLLNGSIVEKSNNDTGGRIIYNFQEFWEKYGDILLAENNSFENSDISEDDIEQFVSNLSDTSRYEVTEGNQNQTNASVKIYTPTTDWILQTYPPLSAWNKAVEKS